MVSLLDALTAGDALKLRDSCVDLAIWLKKGGFVPRIEGKVASAVGNLMAKAAGMST